MSEFDFGETEHSKPWEKLELRKSAWRCKYFLQFRALESQDNLSDFLASTKLGGDGVRREGHMGSRMDILSGGTLYILWLKSWY